jgi:hypothetical protein
MEIVNFLMCAFCQLKPVEVNKTEIKTKECVSTTSFYTPMECRILKKNTHLRKQYA